MNILSGCIESRLIAKDIKDHTDTAQYARTQVHK